VNGADGELELARQLHADFNRLHPCTDGRHVGVPLSMPTEVQPASIGRLWLG
jgi:hypothetical protein